MPTAPETPVYSTSHLTTHAFSLVYATTTRLWDFAAGTHIADLPEAHTRWVRSVAVTADGAYCYSTSDDMTVRIWDLSTRLLVQSYHMHGETVKKVALSANGRAATAGYDRLIKVW